MSKTEWQLSELFRFLHEDIFYSSGIKYKRIPKNVALDGRLSPSDLYVYMAIVFHSDFNREFTDTEYKKLKINDIAEQIYITRRQVISSIQRLSEYNYIGTLPTIYESKYKVLWQENSSYVKFTLAMFNNAFNKDVDKRYFVKKLKTLFFTMNNNALPYYSHCKDMAGGKLDRRYYKNLIIIMARYSSVVGLYKSLNSI